MMLRHLPNLLSGTRMVMAVPIAVLIVDNDMRLAATLFVIVAASDAIDGALARQFGWESRLGGILDPLADKFLMLLTASALWYSDHLPTWFLGLILLRDLTIVCGAYVYNRWIAPLQPEPSILSKLTTAVHATMLVGFILEGHFGINDRVCQLLLIVTTLLLVLSGVHYVARYTRRALALRRQEPTHD